MDADVIVIGAGASGLGALLELDRAQVKTICLEARDRVGGRIYTVRPPGSPIPIELGAEFVHGRSPEIWKIADQQSLGIYDCHEDSVYMKNGKRQFTENAWLLVQDIMNDLQAAAEKGPDVPFAEFLDGTNHSQAAKDMAMSFVEGFNAARGDEIGIASLAEDSKAADAIDGDRSFRMLNGYDSIPHALMAGLREGDACIQTGNVVEAVLWRAGAVTVYVRSRLTGQQRRLDARAVIVSIPLGVLQAAEGETGTIRFDPSPKDLLEAASSLRFGQVMRTVLLFDHRIWEDNSELSDAGFILSGDPSLPAWWTPLPMRAPILTGWNAARKADPLLGRSSEEIVKRVIEQLARTTGLPLSRLQASLRGAFFHDWSTDPFARGAYSYTPAGRLAARTMLATPVSSTLYFAGEATDTNGHSATVHGAIASGRRAASQVLSNLR